MQWWCTNSVHNWIKYFLLYTPSVIFLEETEWGFCILQSANSVNQQKCNRTECKSLVLNDSKLLCTSDTSHTPHLHMQVVFSNKWIFMNLSPTKKAPSNFIWIWQLILNWKSGIKKSVLQKEKIKPLLNRTGTVTLELSLGIKETDWSSALRILLWLHWICTIRAAKEVQHSS